MDRELDRLVDLLVDHALVVVSGTRVAAELGVPHSTLQERIERLREYGVKVSGIRGRGFLLKAVPDILTARVIQQAARGTEFGTRVHHYYCVDSTMSAAATLAQQGELHGAIVLAEEQTAGRGRLGRSWHSERGAGIYCSILLRPKLPAALAPVLTLTAGLAAADAVTELIHQPADLRWPNDVLIALGDDRSLKCCGILPEMTAEAERVKHVVLGIGLNVNQREFPKELAGEATSLARAAGRPLSRTESLGALLRALDRRYRQLLDSGPAAVLAEFERRSSLARSRRVLVENEGAGFTGETRGLDACGFLLVRREDTGTIEPVLAGKVRPA